MSSDPQQQDMGFERVETETREVPLIEIRPTEVSSSEVQPSIETFGLTSDPLLQEAPGDPQYNYRVVDGRRRVDAARKADDTDVIHAKVLGAEYDAEADALTFVHNLARSPSPVQEAEAIQDLLSGGYTEESLTRLGVPRQTIRKRLRLASSPETIKQAVREGEIAEGTAERVANLSVEMQKKCVEHYQREGKLRGKDVTAIRQRKINDRADDLPDDLFDGDDEVARDRGDGAPQSSPSSPSKGETNNALTRATRAAKQAVHQGTPAPQVMKAIRDGLDEVT